MTRDRSLPRWVWAAAGLTAAGLLVYLVRNALTPIFFAFLIAYFLDPVVDRFEKRGIPRALGIVILLALTLGGAALVFLLIVPSVVHEVAAFARELPGKLAPLRGRVEPWLAEHGVEVPHTFDELLALVDQQTADNPELPQLAGSAASVLGAAGKWLLGTTDSLLAVLASALIVPVFAFYLLYDFDRMVVGIRDLVPWRYRPFVVDVMREVDEVLGQFVRGQLLVMIALAALYSLAYWICGVRLAIPIGIVAGLVSFIPYVGGATALILALAMCLLNWQGWGQIAGVVAVYGVIQVLEGFVITPRIVGDKVGLPGVWVLAALMIGGELFGFLGVLLAVPVAAVVKIFVLRAVAYYRKTALYREGAPAEGEGALVGILEEEGLPDDPDVAVAKAVVHPAAPADPLEDELDAAFAASTADAPPPESAPASITESVLASIAPPGEPPPSAAPGPSSSRPPRPGATGRAPSDPAAPISSRPPRPGATGRAPSDAAAPISSPPPPAVSGPPAAPDDSIPGSIEASLRSVRPEPRAEAEESEG